MTISPIRMHPGLRWLVFYFVGRCVATAARWLADVWQDILRMTGWWEDLWKHVKWLPIKKRKGYIIHSCMTNGKVLLTDKRAQHKAALCSKGNCLPKPDQGLATEATRGILSSWGVRVNLCRQERSAHALVRHRWPTSPSICQYVSFGEVRLFILPPLQWELSVSVLMFHYQSSSFKWPDGFLYWKRWEVWEQNQQV